MGTIVYGCGCFISTSMFGDRPYLHVTPCMEHAMLCLQKELKELATAIRNIERPIKTEE